jgi:hypothetical protein
MTMEKNGAISSATPNACGNNCGCSRVKQANSQKTENLKQLELVFPEDNVIADKIDKDTLKEAIDCVKNASVHL